MPGITSTKILLPGLALIMIIACGGDAVVTTPTVASTISTALSLRPTPIQSPASPPNLAVTSTPFLLPTNTPNPTIAPRVPPTMSPVPTIPIPPDDTVRRSDGAELIYDPLTRQSAQNPAFSPDGRTVLFTIFEKGYNDGPAGLFLLQLDGGEISVLLMEDDQDSVNLPGTSWNPTNGLITFSSDRQDRPHEIWTIEPDGSGLTLVTHHTSETFFTEPSFSPDGEWIVFEVDDDVPDDTQNGSIWKVRSDGSELRQLTDGPAVGTDDRQPNWSPTGEEILFQRRVSGDDNWDLYIIDPDGDDLRPLVTLSSSDTDASWSPDGEWIVFSSDYHDLALPQIYVSNVNDGELVRVTQSDAFADGAPSWSWDGEWIAFESHADEDAAASIWRIQVPN